MTGELFEITSEPLSVDDVVARLEDPAVGGAGLFVGIVRGKTNGRETLYLHYEAYPEMAQTELQRIGEEIRQRWRTIREVAIVHRIGRLHIGDIIVVIAVSSAHRQELFDATHYAIDRIKEIVPIWKKEVWADGEAWRTEQGIDVGPAET